MDGLDVQEGQLRGGMTAGDPAYGLTERTGRLVDAGGDREVPIERGDYPRFYEAVVRWLRFDAGKALGKSGERFSIGGRSGPKKRRCAGTISPMPD